ncbi:hypothetical protein GCM10022243_48320 [Saccharothrix violaceirubra]|uniref:Uncharacterized protein n=1 Tax=Saccharothrix violaceirubra TaxID=413306 RepID=A0A7W7WU54_9PSEU|nr:hypothetical protein [Saccharothrix violaceirubra]MBB4963826.1 hypothetical protein [Saccharothrix violaceirubra]
MRCIMQNPGVNEHEPAVAVIVTHVEDGNRIPICKRDLDWWLDDADDNPGMEPADLVFL